MLFLLCFVFTGYGQNISVNFPNITVERALEILRNQEGYSFSVKTNDVNLQKKVNANLQNQPIEKVLSTIFQGQPVSFEIDGKMVRIIKGSDRDTKASQTATENRKISGRVTDRQGEPLIGVSIIAKGSNEKGTMTNIDGYYSLSVPDKSILQFSYIGYDTQELKVGKSDILNATLQEKINDLDEVVVIGYGSMKKSDLTGAVSTVKTEDLPMSANTSISHMLSGRAAGITSVQNSAQPGGGVTLRIRGEASTGAGNEPLYIIDGFPIGGSQVEPAADNRYTDFGSRNPLNSINPNDIESIEILKDASSTAIYGARAANGVIIITTKKGREGKPVVNYSANYGVQQIANKTEMMNAQEFMTEANKFAKEQWLYNNRIYPYGNTDPSTITDPIVYPYTDSAIRNAGEGTDWYDLITREGMIHQHNLSVSGGTSNLRYMASFNFFDQNGVVRNSDFTRYTGRLNVEHQINKIFKYGVNATQSYIKSTNVPLGTEDFENSGLINSAMSYDPTTPVYNKDGSYAQSERMTTVPNPVSMLEIDDYTQTKRLLVNAYLQAEIIKGLVAKVNIGFDDQTGVRNSYIPTTTLYGKQEGGKASKSMAQQFDRLLEATVNYDFSIAKAHKFNILAGYSYQDFTNEGFSAANSQFFTDIFKYNSLASGEAARPTVASNKSKTMFISYFGRINYNLFDKYLFTLTLITTLDNRDYPK